MVIFSKSIQVLNLSPFLQQIFDSGLMKFRLQALISSFPGGKKLTLLHLQKQTKEEIVLKNYVVAHQHTKDFNNSFWRDQKQNVANTRWSLILQWLKVLLI